jgi:hypothetical protein
MLYRAGHLLYSNTDELADIVKRECQITFDVSQNETKQH